MEQINNNIENEKNSFFSRGCCQPPHMYQDNSTIAKHSCCMLDSYDWLGGIDLPHGQPVFDYIEVRFKNSRKDFFRTLSDTNYNIGDIVAVEASAGHDVGIVSLVGEIVKLQMKKKKIVLGSENIKKVYRKARLTDIEKWLNAVEREEETIYKSKKIVDDIGISMKINDIEYQGDDTKAIFYYTSGERVDFRELIKVFADEFNIRVEMRQIGVRQEASRLGGIGSCGRELCCSTWLTNFCSVTTNTARTQQLSMNPQKLAGQCGKLKCCLNFENDVYLDALQDFPNPDIILKTEKGEAIHQKSDVFKKIMWYSYIKDQTHLIAIPIDKVKEIIDDNKKGVYPKELEDFLQERKDEINYGSNIIEEEDINRFDKPKPRRRSRRRR